MHLRVDSAELWYGAKIGILMGAVFFVGSRFAREAGRWYEGMAPVATMAGSRPSGVPLASAEETLTGGYRRLADDAVIFANHEEVLAHKNALIADKTDFIFADLTHNEISLYLGGELFRNYAIKGHGKAGTFFETPNGFYKIKSREENHFSSIGHVWMPYSMHFFGNYFIHGWPYYPDGKPVPQGYSGGCIRLSTEDAKELFTFSAAGMPVLTYSETTDAGAAAGETYFLKVGPERPADPVVTAPSLLVADFENGQILFDRNKNETRPIASLTKLMTALVAIETINRFKPLAMTDHAIATLGESADLEKGEIFMSQDYLYPLIIASSNDVATLYQDQVYSFVNIMNEKARGIGMTGTHYADASGLDPASVSTAEDLFKLIRYISTHKKPIFAISGLQSYTLQNKNGTRTHTWSNVNWPADDETFVGGKAGFISASGQTMTGVYRVKFAEQGERQIAIIVLDSHDRVADVKAVITWLEQNFVYGTVFAKKEEIRTPPAKLNVGAAVYEAIPAVK